MRSCRIYIISSMVHTYRAQSHEMVAPLKPKYLPLRAQRLKYTGSTVPDIKIPDTFCVGCVWVGVYWAREFGPPARAGIGGVGSVVAEMLTRCGIGPGPRLSPFPRDPGRCVVEPNMVHEGLEGHCFIGTWTLKVFVQ